MQNSGMGQDGPKEPIVILLSDLSFHHRFFYPSWNLYIHLLVYLREDLYHSTFSGECKVYANKHVF